MFVPSLNASSLVRLCSSARVKICSCIEGDPFPMEEALLFCNVIIYDCLFCKVHIRLLSVILHICDKVVPNPFHPLAPNQYILHAPLSDIFSDSVIVSYE